MPKIFLGLLFAFYLGGLVGCAEWPAADGRDNIPAGGGTHRHMMPVEQGNNQMNEQRD